MNTQLQHILNHDDEAKKKEIIILIITHVIIHHRHHYLVQLDDNNHYFVVNHKLISTIYKIVANNSCFHGSTSLEYLILQQLYTNQFESLLPKELHKNKMKDINIIQPILDDKATEMVTNTNVSC